MSRARKLAVFSLMASCILAAGQPAYAAGGSEGCKLVGMFDARARQICEAAVRASAAAANNRPAPAAPGDPHRSDSGAGRDGRRTDEGNVSVQTPRAPSSAGAPTTRRSQAASIASSSRAYRSEQFSGLNTWTDMFDKAANNPQDFSRFLGDVTKAANGADAAAYGLVTGPKRNNYQKILTDYELYRTYDRSPASLLAKQQQCRIPREYTPEEACDCVAGFPGTTGIGPGAGELVLGSNHALAVKACGEAAAAATDPARRARYTAQRARAQVYTFDVSQAVTWADEALAAGYKRANIVKATAFLRSIEVQMSGFPPMTEPAYNEEMKQGLTFLRASKAAGIRETYIVARQYQQVISRLKFNSAVLTPVLKSMLTPPPATDDSSCQDPGNLCQGEKLIIGGRVKTD